MRIGNLYGPDATFLGVPGADPDAPETWEHALAAIVGFLAWMDCDGELS